MHLFRKAGATDNFAGHNNNPDVRIVFLGETLWDWQGGSVQSHEQGIVNSANLWEYNKKQNFKLYISLL